MTVKEGENSPVISHSFASQKLGTGETWNIYLQAKDPDGDMKQIVCMVEEPGYGPHPITFIRLKADSRSFLSGYIYMNTRTDFGFGFSSCVLTVQIQDSQGHYSNPVSFPVSLHPRYTQDPPPPGLFQDRPLGPVQVSLASTPGP